MSTYPWGYGTQRRTLDDIAVELAEHYHPEYLRRLCRWLEHNGGAIGIGGHWRAGGAQPDKPGFAPEGKSFHQDQGYADGVVAACAVDLVKTNPTGGTHLAVTWADVPAQGSADAATWGLHANVGTPGTAGSEPWHLQPVEIDGWQTWWNTGRPAPAGGYPIPSDNPDQESTDVTVKFFMTPASPTAVWVTTDDVIAVRVTQPMAKARRDAGLPYTPVKISAAEATRYAYVNALELGVVGLS